MIVRLGRYKLFRWSDGSRTLQVRIDDPFAPAPVLPKWKVFFVGVFPDHVVWSYKRVTA